MREKRDHEVVARDTLARANSKITRLDTVTKAKRIGPSLIMGKTIMGHQGGRWAGIFFEGKISWRQVSNITLRSGYHPRFSSAKCRRGAWPTDRLSHAAADRAARSPCKTSRLPKHAHGALGNPERRCNPDVVDPLPSRSCPNSVPLRIPLHSSIRHQSHKSTPSYPYSFHHPSLAIL